MKKISTFRCMIAALALIAATASAQQKKLSTVQVVTRLTQKNMPVTNYTAVFMCRGQVTDSIHITNFSQPMNLEKGQVYTVYYKKQGSPEKCVIIDTNLPEDAILRSFRVHIHVELDPACSGQKEGEEDFPSAIIKYIQKDKNFGYIREYHQQIHRG